MYEEYGIKIKNLLKVKKMIYDVSDLEPNPFVRQTKQKNNVWR